MATVDTRLGGSAHFANVLGLLGDRGRISPVAPPVTEAAVTFDPENAEPALVFSNGNRTVRAQTLGAGLNNYLNVVLDVAIVTGKRYIEFKLDTISNGFMPSAGTLGNAVAQSFVGDGVELGTSGHSVRANGDKYSNGSLAALLPAFAPGDILMLAVNVTAKRVWFGRNGTWAGNPGANTGPAYTTLEPFNIAVTEAAPLRLAASLYFSSGEPSQLTVQGTTDTFTYAPPTGFVGVHV